MSECHETLTDSPKALLNMYGAKGGFDHKIGDVAGMDVIAIPMNKVNAELISGAKTNLWTTAIWLVLLFGAILIAFRYLVSRRLAAITACFQEAALHRTHRSARFRCKETMKSVFSPRTSMPWQRGCRLCTSRWKNGCGNGRPHWERERRTLLHLLHSSDHERQVIAYEIHDGLAQELTGAIMCSKPMTFCENRTRIRQRKLMAAGLTALRQSLAEARRLISGVRPPVLDESGVVAAIAHLILELQARAGTPEISFQRDVAFERLSPVLENAIYRIVQEGLTNACKHSKSENVRVELCQDGDKVRIVVQDWGTGINLDELEDGHFGLEGIRQRARMLGGGWTSPALPARAPVSR